MTIVRSVRPGGQPLRNVRWAWAAAIPLAVLLALPGAGAVGVLHPAKHVAPFHGTLHIGSTVTSSGCGGSASLVVPPTFNFTTGVGREFGRSAATGCGPPGFSDYGATEMMTGLDSSPVLMHAPAAHNFSFVARLNVTWNLSATPMNPFGGPFAWASAAIAYKGELLDLTNSSVRASFTFLAFTITTNSSVTGNATGFLSGPAGFGFFNFTKLTAVGHHYMFEFYVQLFEWAHAPSGTLTHATARINMATAGHQLRLISWSLG
jgi:hypothetical protein